MTRALLVIGEACCDMGRPQEAEDCFRKTIDHCKRWTAEFPDVPNHPLHLGNALTNLAKLLQRSDRLDEAEQAYFLAWDLLENVVQRWPGPDWYRHDLGHLTLPSLARFLESRQRFDEAETAWRRAIVLAEQLAVESPYSYSPWLLNSYRMNLINVLMKLGKDEETEKVVSASRPVPRTAEELTYRAELYETVHQYDKALADYSRALELEPNAARYVSRAEIYSQQEEYDKARADYEKAVELDPTFAHRQCLGAMLYRAGRFDQAMEILTSLADSEQPEAASPAYGWYFLVMTHHKLNNVDQAAGWLDKANAWTDRILAEAQADGESRPWNRRLTLKLLRSEAEALLNGALTDEQPKLQTEDAPEPDEPNTEETQPSTDQEEAPQDE